MSVSALVKCENNAAILSMFVAFENRLLLLIQLRGNMDLVQKSFITITENLRFESSIRFFSSICNLHFNKKRRT